MFRNIAIVVLGLAIGIAVVLVLRPRDKVEASPQTPSGQTGIPAAKGTGCANCDLPSQ